MPFNVQELNDEGGVYYGINQVSKNINIGNRKKLINGNGFVFGVPGSGKSFFCKAAMGQVFLSTDDEIIIIDPMNEYFEISETSEKIYIGSDFPDEFSHSNDTKGLKGANMKAKANITPAIGELIQIASEKAQYPDYNNKHGAKAKFGWYRYNTRFGIPVYDEDGNLERYNIFSTRMLVRCDADGKLYLYDLVRTKKETSKPHEQ